SEQKTYATFGLALAVLPGAHWDALTPSRPLRRFRMLEVQRGSTLTSAPLRVDERILHFLAGSNVLDPRLQSFVRDSPSPGWIADEQRDTAVHAARLLENYAEYSPLVHLCGDDRLGHEDIAAVAAHELRRRLVVVSADALPAIGPDLDQFALLWERESL